MSRYLVTTPGASATRWLSFALASHPDVYVTHGKFALDSVSRQGLDEEHRQGDRGSLTRGNELREFYAVRTLDEIFAAYREAVPSAAVHGNVHTFTIGELLQREENGESLEGIRIVNLVRHPIAFIESHTALVKSAEAQPDLREHYRRVFREAVEFCPEALLVETDQPLEAMAFVVSCYAARQTALDLACARWPNARMEDLTTDVAALSRFCRDVTGLQYPAAELERLVNSGPINSHRAKPRPRMDASRLIHPGPRRAAPAAAWHEWPAWRRDVFALFVTPELFDLWEAAGYDVRVDVRHLRHVADAASVRADAGSVGHDAGTENHVPFLPVQSSGPCLGDFSDDLGLRRERPAAVLLEENFCGFNLYEAGPQGIALATSLGDIDWRQIDLRTLAAWQREGFCIQAPSVEVIRELLLARPPALADSHAGFNIVTWRGKFFVVAQCLGPIDLTTLGDDEKSRFAADESLLWSNTLEEAFRLIDERNLRPLETKNRHSPSPQLVAEHNGYNIVEWRGRFAALAQSAGPVDLTALSPKETRRLELQLLLLWGDSLDEVRGLAERVPAARGESWLRQLGRRAKRASGPPQLVESRSGFNVVEWRGRFAAVAQSAGEIDLTELSAAELKELEADGGLVWGWSLARLRRRLDASSIGPPQPWMLRLHRRAKSAAGVPRRAASAGWRACRRLLRPAGSNSEPDVESSEVGIADR